MSNKLTEEQLNLNKQYSLIDYGNTNTPYDSAAIQVSKISNSITGHTQPYNTSMPSPANNPPSISYNFYSKKK